MSNKRRNYNRNKRLRKAANMDDLNNMIEKFNNHSERGFIEPGENI